MNAVRTGSRRCLHEELEPRLLYAADLAAVPAADTASGFLLDSASIDFVDVGEPSPNDSVIGAAVEARTREIAFVDETLDGVDVLIEDLLAMNAPDRDIQVILLRSDGDGIAQISAALSQREGIDAVHLLSHGADGSIRVGGVSLDFDSLLARAGQVREWRDALSAQADIFLYGCDVARSPLGQSMVEALARLTGADVSASSDVTGARAAGGDWQLEYTHGDTDAALVLGFLQPVAWQGVLPNEFQVNSTTSSDQTTAGAVRGSKNAVAMDGTGKYVVVWTSDGQDGSQAGVYARRFAANGTALTGEILVNQTTTRDQKWASVATDAAGNFVVTWTNRDDGGDQGDVYFRRFDGNGTALTAETLVNTTVTTSTQENSAIAMDATSGDFVVVWEGVGAGDGDGVFFRRYNADGTAKDATEQSANSTDLGNEHAAAVAMSASGSFVVTWERDDHLYFQRFNAAGVAQGAITQGDSGLSNVGMSTVGMNAAGDFTVLYRVTNGLLVGVWGRGFNADGTEKYTYFQAASGDASDPSIAMASDGSFIMTYEGSGDGAALGVYARKYLANGNADGSAFVVNQHTTGNQDNASVALLSVSNSVIVWSGQGAGDNNGVHARQYGASNVAPVNSVPGAQSTREDEELTFSSGNGNLISISDADAGTAAMQVTLTATNGVITLGSTASLSFSAGTGTGDAVMTFSATRTQINTALSGLRFIPTANYNGAATLQIDTDDLGNTGFGGPLTDSDTVAITVTAVNDAPTAVNDAYTVLQGQTLTVAAGTGLLANDTDPEAGTLEVLTGTDTSNGTLTFAANGSFSYTPTALFTGTDSFSYLARDTSDGRTHYWGLGGHALDAIGVANGTISGASTVAGQFGSALGFDGTDDYVTIPDFTYSNEFSVSLWFKTPSNAGTGYGYLYSHGVVGNQNSINVYTIEDSAGVAGVGKLRTQIMDGNDTVDLIGLDVDITSLGMFDNNWHLYTLTTEAGVGARVYVDGVLRASSSRGGDAIDPAGSLILGARQDLSAIRFFSGAIDAVQVHDRRLQLGEVQDILTAAPATVTFTVTANTAPAITSNGGGNSAAISVAENATAVTTVTATDAQVPPQSLTYSLSGADAGRFTIGSASGVLTFSVAPDRENPLDADSNHTYEVTVTVSDGVSTDAQALSITVTDVNESAVSAIVDNNGGANALNENSANGSAVGITALATDADNTNNTITYSLDNDAGGRFTIDSGTGVISVVGSSLLDYESATSHSVVVRATSADLSASTATFAITLLPLNDNMPAFTSTAAPSLSEGGTAVVTLAATDADAPVQTLGYTITGGVDQSYFVIASGVLRFAVAPDYETPLDADVDNVYLVQVTVSDGAGGSAIQNLSVAVSDAAETPVSLPPPVVTPPPVSPSTDPGGSDVVTTPPTSPSPEPEVNQTTSGASVASAPMGAAIVTAAPATEAAGDTSATSTGASQDRSTSTRRTAATTGSGSQAGVWIRPASMPISQGEGSLLAPGVTAPPATAVSVDALRSSLAGTQWLGQLQYMREQMEKEVRLDGIMVGTTAFVSGGLSVGYVIWLVRGGLLMSTLLSSLPAWQSIDPLPVLGQRSDEDEKASRSDAVESLFERAKKAWRPALPASAASPADGAVT